MLGEAGRPSLWFSATDGRHIAATGIPTVGLGPGNPRLAHTEEEWIHAEDLLPAAQIYAALAAAPFPVG